MPTQLSPNQVDTRKRLLNAALKSFGSKDYEGVSTREIVEMAEANISAISYHFENKRGLYNATVSYLSETLHAGIAEQLESINQNLEHYSAEDCADQTCQLLLNFFEHTLLGEIGKHAPGIIFREQSQPSEAYQILFDNFLQPMNHTLAKLVAKYLGSQPREAEVLFLVHALIGQTVMFHIGKTTLLRLLKKKNYSRAIIEAIKNHLTSNYRVLLESRAIYNNL
ncbi:MAG: CerR family C-terminal domain-containing protein [Candidatus Thiodiazotropha sp. 6PLUC2]